MTVQTSSTANGLPLAAEIADLHRNLEILAQDGKWSELADVMQRRDELLHTVTDIDRAILFSAAVRSNERLLKLAQADRQAVAHQLSSLRRSREGASRYDSHQIVDLEVSPNRQL